MFPSDGQGWENFLKRIKGEDKDLVKLRRRQCVQALGSLKRLIRRPRPRKRRRIESTRRMSVELRKQILIRRLRRQENKRKEAQSVMHSALSTAGSSGTQHNSVAEDVERLERQLHRNYHLHSVRQHLTAKRRRPPTRRNLSPLVKRPRYRQLRARNADSSEPESETESESGSEDRAGGSEDGSNDVRSTSDRSDPGAGAATAV